MANKVLPLGIDISDKSIKMVGLEQTRNSEHIVTYGEIKLSPGLIIDGAITEKSVDPLAKHINYMTKHLLFGRLKTKEVVCALPEEKSFLRIIPIAKTDLLEEAITNNIESHIPIKSELLTYDWAQIGEQKDHVDILINATLTTIAKSYVDVFKLAGLEPVALETESISSARSAIPKGAERSEILLDIGSSKTNISIIVNGIVGFTSTFASSKDESITEKISKSLQITSEEAEKLKNYIGLEDKRVARIVTPEIEDFIKLLKNYFDFYEQHTEHLHTKESKISTLTICGGGSLIKGLSNYLSLRLRKNVIISNPLINLNYTKGVKCPLSNVTLANYTTALGLAQFFKT